MPVRNSLQTVRWAISAGSEWAADQEEIVDIAEIVVAGDAPVMQGANSGNARKGGLVLHVGDDQHRAAERRLEADLVISSSRFFALIPDLPKAEISLYGLIRQLRRG